MNCNETKKNIVKEEKTETIISFKFDTYKIFDEPDDRGVRELSFYLLFVSYRNLNNSTILSIREDSAGNTNGYYKTVPYSQVPSIQQVIDFDTTKFEYSTIHFKLQKSDLDSIKSWINKSNFQMLHDTVQTKSLDGTMKELAIFNGVNFVHIYRNVGSDDKLEENLKNFISKISIYYPSKPLPFYERE